MDFIEAKLEPDCPVMMRDGTVLRADVYRPSKLGRFPVLLLRTPYNKRTAQMGVYQHPSWYVRRGYIVVVQDARGRFASEGSFAPYVHEGDDGADTIEWAAALEGSNGKVGTYGFSYSGANQLMAACRRPAGLVCSAIGCSGPDYFDGWTYRSGALQLAFVLSWTVQALSMADALRRGDREKANHLRVVATDMRSAYVRPLRDWLSSGDLPEFFNKWIEGDVRNDYWQSISSVDNLRNVSIPTLCIGGWYDIFLQGTLDLHERLSQFQVGAKENSHYLVVGPWQHVPWSRLNGSIDYGTTGDNCADELQLSWFDHWLKDRSFEDSGRRVRYFLMGANEWHSDSAWPPPNAVVQKLYLHSTGSAGRQLSDGRLADALPGDETPDVYIYDPSEPVPSIGGASCCRSDVAPVGAFDQSRIESRTDVLTYTTDRLKVDCDVVGPVELYLYAATDAVDTDWTAKLVDVYPSGEAINICDGILRARYRDSLDHPKLLQPGRTYEYRVQLSATAMRFKAGHAIRLEISSSNFPNYDVNLNIGRSSHLADMLDAFTATQVVYHDKVRPSHLQVMLLNKIDVVAEDRRMDELSMKTVDG